ncbi:hypothetical protein HPP92_009259 [Vanilla planifolia]|uniref:Uncharacterized protein n=1 Tax=Vanilla planifolia TaxID=51239 RepID=A0A835V4J8_VANPL|nr:hypothetical protein HPP92_009259 [Vanilla planifolia]
MEDVKNPDSEVGEEKLLDKGNHNAQEILINGDENIEEHSQAKHVENFVQLSANQDSSITTHEQFEQGKIRALELQLQKTYEELQHSEFERTHLKSEADLASEKLKVVGRQYEELQLECERLKEEKLAEEHRNTTLGVSLQEALKDLDNKHNEISETKEAFNGLNADIESSKKKIVNLEQLLEESTNQARKFEELSIQCSSDAESQTKRALEIEKLMEAAKQSSTELEDLVNKMQDELKELRERLQESKRVEEILEATKLELAAALDNLEVSKSSVGELEQILLSKEAAIAELTRELDLKSTSEEQVKQDKLVVETLLSSIKEDLHAKVVALEETELKVVHEVKTRKAVEDSLKEQRNQVLALQEELTELKEDKESLQSKLSVLITSENELKAQLKEAENLLQSAEKHNTELELQLSVGEQKHADTKMELEELGEKSSNLSTLLRETEDNHAQALCHVQAYEERVSQIESSLSLSYSKNSELEKELKVLVEKCAGLEEQVSMAHKRSVELDSFLQISESKLDNAEKKAKELELLLEAAKHERRELEEHLNAELQELREKSHSLEVAVLRANEKEKQLTESLNLATEEKNKYEDLSTSSASNLLKAENVIKDLQVDLECTKEKLEAVERDLKASGLREDELAGKLKTSEEKLEYYSKSEEQYINRYLELESAHDFLLKDSERKLEEVLANFSQKELENKQMHDKIKFLEEQAAFYQEQVTETTEKLASLMLDLEANAARLTAYESTIEELNGKLLETESKAEHSFAERERLKKELEESQVKINELQGLLTSIHGEKEATDGQLLSCLQNITELTNERANILEKHSQIEASNRETEAKWTEALERYAQRDSDARDLSEKLLAHEAQLKVHEKHANEASAVAETCKGELENAMLKIQSLEKSVFEANDRATLFEGKHDDLSKENLSLSHKLMEFETKVNELEGTQKAITAEKDDISLQLQSSRKAVDDLSQQLDLEKEKLQSQIFSALDEKNSTFKLYKDSKEECELLKAQLEEMLNLHKNRESSLNADLEDLKAELSAKSQLQDLVSELERQLSEAVGKHKEEVKNMGLAAAEKDLLLTSKLKEHASAAEEREGLIHQLNDLQNEHNIAQKVISEQKESILSLQQERDSVLKSSQDEIKAEQQRSLHLETQIEELKQKLETNQAHNKVNDGITEVELKELKQNPEILNSTQQGHQEGKARRKAAKQFQRKPLLLLRSLLLQKTLG